MAQFKRKEKNKNKREEEKNEKKLENKKKWLILTNLITYAH